MIPQHIIDSLCKTQSDANKYEEVTSMPCFVVYHSGEEGEYMISGFKKHPEMVKDIEIVVDDPSPFYPEIIIAYGDSYNANTKTVVTLDLKK